MNNLFLPVSLALVHWALTQSLGTAKGNAVYNKVAPVILAAIQAAEAETAAPAASAAPAALTAADAAPAP